MRTDEGCWSEMFLPSEDTKLDISYDKWRSPIHMPREAARIFLRIKSVRAERLQDISERDALDEGANFKDGKNVGFEKKMQHSAIDRYRDVWDGINTKRGYPWKSNPWVWVYEFERIERPNES